MQRPIGYLWEAPPPTFLKVNIDDSVIGTFERAGFVIRASDSRLVVAGGSHFFSLSVPRAELQTAWTGIVYARYSLG